MSKNDWGNICDRVDTCALTGAAAFFAGIPDAEILVNGPLWCYFYALRHLEHAVYNMAERLHGSQPDNSAIVYGTEKFLKEALTRLLNSGHTPSILLVENSCSLSLIGDDLAGIVRSMELPFPVVTMDSGGLNGGFAEGYAKACISLLDQVLTYKKIETHNNSINLLGLSDFYYNGINDRKEICRIAAKAGYQINCVVGGGSTLNQLKNIGSAALNVVCNEELGLKIARYLKERYGTPYICSGLPYGIEGTKKWLEGIHAALPCAALAAVISECDAMQQRLTAWNNEIHCLWGDLWFDNILVSAPGTTALCMGEAVRSEWADTGRLTVICQQPVINNKYCTIADDVFIAGADFSRIDHYLKNIDNVLVLGSSSENSLLWRRRNCTFASCNIAYPANDEVLLIDEPFAGIRGSAHMQQCLWNAFIRQVLAKQGK